MINESNGEAEVDVINPLTPEIRCSNCIYSSDYRDMVGSAIDCNTCHNHSLFIHIPETAPRPAPDRNDRNDRNDILHLPTSPTSAIPSTFLDTLNFNCYDCRHGVFHDNQISSCSNCIDNSNFTPHTPENAPESTQIGLEAIKMGKGGSIKVNAPEAPEAINTIYERTVVGNAIDGLEL